MFYHQDHRGGLLDKPGKSRDFYHTCYTLSGLALAQIFASPGLLNTSVLGSFRLESYSLYKRMVKITRESGQAD